jgi:hypothetical protein
LFLRILLTAKEPLSVGLESIGIKTLLYKLPVVLRNGVIMEIPVIPGNSFRGVLRDTMSKRFILDVCRASSEEKIAVDPGTALSMFSGGILSKPKKSDKKSKEDSIYTLIEGHARYLLPLSILGFAVSNTIVPGKIKVGCGYPVVRETKELIEDLYWEDTGIELANIYTTVLLTRKNDLEKISQIREIEYDKDEAQDYLRREEKEAGALQQRMEREAVIAGTRFVTFIRDILPLKPEEEGLLLKTIGEVKSVGGSTARGLGEVKLSIFNEQTREDAESKYEAFIQENIREIREQLKKSPMEL